MAQTATKFSSGLYLPFRPFADPAGLECLDSHTDLWTGWNTPEAYNHTADSVNIERGDAVNATRPMIGFQTCRAVDRFRLTFTSLRSGVGALAPTPFQLVVKLQQSCAGEDAQFDKLITVPTFDRTGLLCQLSGLLFDTVQIWMGSDFGGDATIPNTQWITLRCFVDRMGHGTHSTDPLTGLDAITVIDGPFV